MAVSKRLRYEVFRRDSHTCRYCGRSAPEVRLRPDHVIPEALGGQTTPENLVTSCEDCNAGKSSVAPDSPLVAEVASDAIRWAQAVRAAGERMLADTQNRDARRAEFLEAWNTWKYSDGNLKGQSLPLPNDWENTVDRLIAAGLPLPLLVDSIDVAMTTKNVKDVFRYMCGVSWTRVTQIQESAREALSPTTGSNQESTSVDLATWIIDVLDANLTDDEKSNVLRRAKGQLADQGCDHPSREALLGEMIEILVADLHQASDFLDHLFTMAKGLITADEATDIERAAFTEVSENLGPIPGVDHTGTDLAHNGVRHALAFLAKHRGTQSGGER